MMMNVFIEDIITHDAFMEFEIGKALNLDFYSEGIDYNKIGFNDNFNGYYFFNRQIDVEVYERNGFIRSFDIKLKNQNNHLYIGEKNTFHFKLNNCSYDRLLDYLNKNNLKWILNSVTEDKNISVVLCSKLQFIFYFDYNVKIESSLSLISLYQI